MKGERVHLHEINTCSRMSPYQYLGLAKNHLTGCIPASFASLQRLLSLALYGNLLSGLVPAGIQHLTCLQVRATACGGVAFGGRWGG